MQVFKDEFESDEEYWARVENVNRLMQLQEENSEKYQRLLKFMPKLDAFEAVYGPIDGRQALEEKQRQTREKFDKEDNRMKDFYKKLGKSEKETEEMMELVSSDVKKMKTDLKDV